LDNGYSTTNARQRRIEWRLREIRREKKMKKRRPKRKRMLSTGRR